MTFIQPLQLRVIRAFKSTLEDMEEKRSCHSMHSLRSTRSYLTRPTSDISYIDDEDRGRKGGGQTATNGHYIRAAAAPATAASAAHGMSQQNYAKSVEAPSSSHYLKVEGGAYRVQRSVSSGSGTLAQAAGPRSRACSDAATQSVESSFTQTDESLLAPLANNSFSYGGGGGLGGPPPLFAMGPPPSPVPPVFIETSSEVGGVGGGGRMSVMGYTRATSPTPPQQYGHMIPSPYYHPPYYEPAYYHTYLNPMAAAAATGLLPEGYQYEVVVRRPSMGPTELTVPVPNAGDLSRRPSVVGHYPCGPLFPPPHPPHLAHPYSMPGSFDSAQGPPLTPVYNPPLSPRHTSNPPAAAAFPAGPSPFAAAGPPNSNGGEQPLLSGPPNPDSRTITIQPSDIPKLIHETSI